jgi:hypothetical protein
MSGRVSWVRGGEAWIVRVTGDEIELRSTVAWPPGSRVEGVLEGPPAVTVRVKVHASRKTAQGNFEVRGRLLDAAREIRERLALEAESPNAGS